VVEGLSSYLALDQIEKLLSEWKRVMKCSGWTTVSKDKYIIQLGGDQRSLVFKKLSKEIDRRNIVIHGF
jgi:translation initiation factor 1 (eIF-1/SUI1)